MIQNLAEYMNSLTESPSCLQKVPIYQPMLRRAASARDSGIMFLTLLANLLANPSTLFDATPSNLYIVDWIAEDTASKLRACFIKHLVAHLSRKILPPDEFEAEVKNIVKQSSLSKTHFDEQSFIAFLSKFAMDVKEMPEEEAQRLRVEYFYNK